MGVLRSVLTRCCRRSPPPARRGSRSQSKVGMCEGVQGEGVCEGVCRERVCV